MKKRILSLLLCLVMIVAIAVPVMPSLAAGGDEEELVDLDGLVTTKNVTYNGDGTYQIQITAYSTGSTRVVTSPTDIVLVLDQSGSMEERMLREEKTNEQNYQDYQNGKTFYYKSSNNYYPVIVTKDNNWYDGTYYQYSVNYRGSRYEITTSYDGGNAVPDVQFYSSTRLEALKDAVTKFANSVKNNSTLADGTKIDNRIAIVGFASDNSYDSSSGSYLGYENTEVFVGRTQTRYGSRNINTAYGSAFQDVSTETGFNNVTASIAALSASGGTAIDLGTEMANKIFENDPRGNETGRNKVVIVFTDGTPGIFTNASAATRTQYADRAISNTYASIQTYDATVFTVGVFDGADAESPSQLVAARNDSRYAWNSTNNANAENTFMHLLSYNYPDAMSMNRRGNLNPTVAADPSKGYYLSASDPEHLDQIFENISAAVGGSSVELTDDAVVRDVMSQYFKLPDGATKDDITVQTANCITVDDSGTPTFGTPQKRADLSVDVSGDTVSVSGFNFKEHWCGKDAKETDGYHKGGQQLIITFDIVPKDGFLGGNNVPTNDVTSGVYENDSAGTHVEQFPVPQANVEIKQPVFEVKDKTIYQGNSTTTGDLYSDTSIDYTKPENAWMADFVNITKTFTDKDGKPVGESVLPNDCTQYNVTVTYESKPEYTGEKNGQDLPGIKNTEPKSANGTAWIHVLQPVVTAQVNDVQRYYGETYTLGEGAVGNAPITVTWADSHSDHKNIPEVEGSAPYSAADLTLQYAAEGFTGNPQSGTVPKNDFDVQVQVVNTKGDAKTIIPATVTTTCDIGGHANMPRKATTDADHPAYYTVHVKTCLLTITKEVYKDGQKVNDDKGTYVFNIKRDNNDYTQAVITGNGKVTISELPIGTYTVSEDSNWSWRFKTVTFTPNGTVTLGSSAPDGSVTCTNTLTNDQWFNDYSAIAHNEYGKTHTVVEKIAQAIFGR